MKAIHIVILSALLTGAAIKAAPAVAETAPAEVELAVSYVRTADLDLSSERGRKLLERRISTAAREVCGVASDADLEGKNAVRQCRETTLARAQNSRDGLLAAANRGAAIAVTASR